MHNLYIVCGSPGSGKSQYGRELSENKRAVLLDIDTCTEILVRTGLKESGRSIDDRDSEYFKSHYRDPIYQTLFAIARENLKQLAVVVVGPFTREIRQVDWPIVLSKELEGAKVEVHYVYCLPSQRRERLVQRGNPRDLEKLRNWDKYLSYYGQESRPEFSHVYCDTSS